MVDYCITFHPAPTALIHYSASPSARLVSSIHNRSTLDQPLYLSVDCHIYIDWPLPLTFIHRVLQIPPYHQTLVSGNESESYRVLQIARLLSFNEYQTLVSGNESDSFIAFHKSPVCCCSMNSESFRGQPLLFHAPPPAPAFTFIYCAVTVNAPADRFQEDSSDLADVLFRLLYHRARWRLVAFVCRLRRRRAACGRVRVRACRGFCPTFSLYCAVTVNRVVSIGEKWSLFWGDSPHKSPL